MYDFGRGETQTSHLQHHLCKGRGGQPKHPIWAVANSNTFWHPGLIWGCGSGTAWVLAEQPAALSGLWLEGIAWPGAFAPWRMSGFFTKYDFLTFNSEY